MKTTTTYHRDGTVTVWDCIAQQWVRLTGRMSNDLAATLDRSERARIDAHLAARDLSDDQIERLRTEAGEHGDREQVRICDRALAGSYAARRECARVIAAAEAQRDE